VNSTSFSSSIRESLSLELERIRGRFLDGHSSRISVLPPGCGPIYPQVASARNPFCISPRGQGPGRVRQDLCQDQKTRFSPFRSTFSDTPPSASFVVQIGFALLLRLPGWQRQSLHPPQHAGKQPPGHVALCQQ
jgi:hypothetical protein